MFRRKYISLPPFYQKTLQRKWFCSQNPTRAQSNIKSADHISFNCYCLSTITSESHSEFLLIEWCVVLCVLCPWVLAMTKFCAPTAVFVCIYLVSLFPDCRSLQKITVCILFCVNYKTLLIFCIGESLMGFCGFLSLTVLWRNELECNELTGENANLL